MAVGAQRHIDDPGPDLCDLLGAQAQRGDGARPVALHQNVGVPGQDRERLSPLASRRSTKADSFPRPVSMTSGRSDGRCDALTSSTSAPCTASVRPHTGPAMMRVRSKTLISASGRGAADNASGGASPICSMLNSGSPAIAGPADADPTRRTNGTRAATSPASAAAASSASASHWSSARCTAARSSVQRSSPSMPR